jgi:hypothetical protein
MTLMLVGLNTLAERVGAPAQPPAGLLKGSKSLCVHDSNDDRRG